MNLFLVDVCEHFRRRKLNVEEDGPKVAHGDSPVGDGPSDAAAAAVEPTRRPPRDRRDNYETVRRFMHQILIRGDNVVAVHLERAQ